MHAAPLFLAFGGAYAVITLAALRFPAYGNLLSTLTALITVAAFDPYNAAGAAVSACTNDASFWTAAYGSVPFVIGAVLFPRIEIVFVCGIVHSVSTTLPYMPSGCMISRATWPLLVCAFMCYTHKPSAFARPACACLRVSGN
jgi:hypothetical protein